MGYYEVDRADLDALIAATVKMSGSRGMRPSGVKRIVDRTWVGWATPSLRTIERRMANHPLIMKKPDHGPDRRCRTHEPFTFGFYVWKEPSGNPLA